jgi:Arm DNA-binding domain
MALTDIAIRNAKPRAKPYKMGDALGLFLLVQPTGGKLWRLKYRIEGKEKKLAIGTYPEVSLGDARRRREEARELMALGKDPSREKQRERVHAQARAENTFAAIAAEFCEKRKRDGSKAWAKSTATRSEHLLSLLIVPMGQMPLTEIEPADVLAAVRRIERKGKLESARRALQLAGAVFRYAVATARIASDPTRDLRGAAQAPIPLRPAHHRRRADTQNKRHRADALPRQNPRNRAITQIHRIGSGHRCWPPNPARSLNHKINCLRNPHDSFKRHPALELAKLGELLRAKSRPVSDNIINAGLRRLGYVTNETTAHGFRATASTLHNEGGQ